MGFHPLYFLFIAFIAFAYIYYTRRNKQRSAYYNRLRKAYIEKNQDLEPPKKNALAQGHPWVGMDKELLVSLFGDPSRKRPMNEDASQMIWTLDRIYVLMVDDRVQTWNHR